MTTIRTTCYLCGDVELAIEQVTLEPQQYCFDCPECGVTQRRPADRRTTEILLTTGVQYTVVSPITEEEIEAFVKELDQRGVYDE